MGRKLTNKEFIEKARKIHGDKYDYSKVNYINTYEKICIICPKHGEFWQTPSNHINSNKAKGCPKCGIESRNAKNTSINLDIFISKLKEYHPEYDYSITKYLGINSSFSYICPKHGIRTGFASSAFYNGTGCNICAHEKLSESLKLTTQLFIDRSNKIHNYKYDYSKTEYINYNTPVTIICPIHGEFELIADYHLHGNGCPKCNQSHGEVLIEKFLKDNNIPHKYQVPILVLNTKIILDFVVKILNKYLIIEYNGKLHYVPIKYFGGELLFLKQLKRDSLLRNRCKEKEIILHEIPYYWKENEIILYLQDNLK